MQFIGIDIGTLSTKGSLISEDGQILCRTAIPHSVQRHKPDWAEQSAEEVWWIEVREVIRFLLSRPEANPDGIAGIGVSGMFPVLLLADKTGKPLRPALLYSDNRALAELEAFNTRFGMNLTGDAVSPKIAWLRTNEPNVFSRTHYLFSSHNYVVYCLTRAYCLDYKVADSMGGLLDRTKLEWRQDVAEWVGISVERLPTLCSEIEIVGEVTKEAAEQTGLRPGTPVIAGGGDSPFTIVSAGVINRSDALLSFGTTGWMGIVPHRMEDYFHNPYLIDEGSPYLLDAYLLTLGSALQWFRDQFAIGEAAVARRLGTSVYQVLDDEAMQVPPGSDRLVVLPYFLGKRGPGIPQPETATVSGLTLSHTAAHVYRALLESYGYVVRSALKRQEQRGVHVRRIVGTGGGASSSLWRQIISDIIDQPLYYHADADPCLGSAYLVGYALGLWDSLDGILDWLPPAIIAEPSKSTRMIYEESYQRFMDLEATLSV